MEELNFETIDELYEYMEYIEWNNSFGIYSNEEYEALINEVYLIIEDFQDL